MQGWPLSFFDGSNGATQVQIGNDTFMKAYVDEQGDRVLINDNVIDNRNLQPIRLEVVPEVGRHATSTFIAIGQAAVRTLPVFRGT